jgi:hypothetical protein
MNTQVVERLLRPHRVPVLSVSDHVYTGRWNGTQIMRDI